VDEDLVVLHVRSARTSADPRVIVEILRLLPDGRIDEHWDVIQPVPGTESGGNAKAAGAVLALLGTGDAFMATFETLVGKLEAQGDDRQYVILPGQRHDYALQFGWQWANAFLEDRLPAR
jgi:hypothetical protein